MKAVRQDDGAGGKRRGGGKNVNPWRTHGPVSDVTVYKDGTKVVPVEPMTASQRKYLKQLCKDTGVQFNGDWSKRTASTRIKQLKKQKDHRAFAVAKQHGDLTDQWIAAAERAA